MRTTDHEPQSHLRTTVWAAALLALTFAPASLSAQPNRSQPQPRMQQPTKPPAAPVSEAPNVLVMPNEDYRIAPGDVIEVQIEDAPELSRIYRVTASGTFLMARLGRVVAQQKTTEELAKAITDGLRKEEYLKDPQVSITVKQYNSRSFFVQGAVRSPGVYQIEGRPSLLKLLSLAGGLDESHGATAFILREMKSPSGGASGQGTETKAAANPQSAGADANNDDGENYELLKVNLNGLYQGRLDQNVRIEPGDIVKIPPADVFFVAGEVNGPGSFPLKEGTTLRQAISLAQGTTFKAATNRAVIFRDNQETGKRQELPVDVGAVMSGKKEDLAIQANDIIIIPNSRGKTIGSALLTAFGVNSARLPIRY